MAKKPEPISDGPLRAYAHRPPLEGDVRWAWRICYHQGTSQKAVKGAGGRYTPTEVRAQLRELLRRGGWEQSEEVEPEAQPTIGLLLDHWLADCRRRQERGRMAERTLAAYQGARERCRPLDGVDVRQVELVILQRWIDQMEDAGVAASTTRQTLCSLSTAWAWGRARQYVPPADLPHPEVSPAKVPVYNRNTPSLEEALQAHAHLKGWQAVAAGLLLGTGARIGELASLCWRDWREGALRLDGKTGERWVPLGSTAQALLEAWWVGQERPSEGSLWPVSGVRQQLTLALALACQHAGVPVYTPHGLRRLASTRLIAGGADPKSYAAVMGHGYQLGLKVYAETVGERVAATAALLEPGAGVVLSLQAERRRRG